MSLILALFELFLLRLEAAKRGLITPPPPPLGSNVCSLCELDYVTVEIIFAKFYELLINFKPRSGQEY